MYRIKTTLNIVLNICNIPDNRLGALDIFFIQSSAFLPQNFVRQVLIPPLYL